VQDLATACGGGRPIVLVRELTKLHEDIWRGTLADAVTHAATVEPRGEYVLILGGAPPAAAVEVDDIARAAFAALAAGLRGRDAADHVAATLGIARRAAYDAVLAARTNRPPGDEPAPRPADSSDDRPAQPKPNGRHPIFGT
jgi:16S rRNA (cytidine1402-2'-O)-methyltransferase